MPYGHFSCYCHLRSDVQNIDSIIIWPYSLNMAITSIKSTYSLDVETVRSLETLAQRWSVSKSEVLRRAIRLAANEDSPNRRATLGALDQLQASVGKRKVDLTRWGRDVKAERRAAAKRLHSNAR